MSFPQKDNFSAPRMFIMITKAEEEKKLKEIFDEIEIPIYYQCRGQGTAPSEIMDIFGLGGTTRIITMGFLPKFAVSKLFLKTGKVFDFARKGGGIAVTIPITGLQSRLLNLLNDDARSEAEKQIKERIKGDMAEIHEKSRYNAIFVAVEEGYSDQVIDTARSAGAKGGTVLRGRRRNSESISQHFGISIQDEQDLLMIIVPRDIKTEVMTAITSSCGLKSPAHGIAVSLPIDEAVGLEE